MRYRILCYGDSNTWGFISGSDHKRYDETVRWPKLLAKKLGHGFEVIEEGLNSRTLTSDDLRPGKEGKNGFKYFLPCLDSHDPIDLVILMLGTNELKTDFQTPVEKIGADFEEYFVKTVQTRVLQSGCPTPKMLIIAPPLADDDGGGKYIGAYEPSTHFNDIYKAIAEKYGIPFIGNENLITGVDHVHLTKESHAWLAEAVYQEVRKIAGA